MVTVRRVAGAVLAGLIVAGSLLWASPAGAAPIVPIPIPLPSIPLPSLDSCKSVPGAVRPGSGTAAAFDSRPDGGDVSSYDRYGYGPHWAVYDLGCNPVDGWTAQLDTYVGNLGYGLAVDVVSFGNFVHRLVTPPVFLSAFDGLEVQATRGLYENVWLVFGSLALILAGLFVLVKAHGGELSGALRSAVWAVFVIFLATLAYSGPVRLGSAADRFEAAGVDAITRGLSPPVSGGPVSPDPVSSLTVDAVLRPAWMRGELGSSSGVTVDRFGGKLWDSQAETWVESALPDQGKVADMKGSEFRDTASAVHDADPGAYDYLKGQAGGRWWDGWVLAFGGALLVVPFRVAASLYLGWALIVLRILVMLLPALAVPGVFERFDRIMKGALGVGAAALINALVFAGAAALYAWVVSWALSPASGLPGVAGLVLSGVAGFALWKLCKVFRMIARDAMGSWAPARVGGPRRAVGRVREAVEWGAGTAVGAKLGGKAGGLASAAAGAAGLREAVRPVGQRLPSLDRPVYSEPGDERAATAAAYRDVQGIERGWQLPSVTSPPAGIDLDEPRVDAGFFERRSGQLFTGGDAPTGELDTPAGGEVDGAVEVGERRPFAPGPVREPLPDLDGPEGADGAYLGWMPPGERIQPLGPAEPVEGEV